MPEKYITGTIKKSSKTVADTSGNIAKRVNWNILFFKQIRCIYLNDKCTNDTYTNQSVKWVWGIVTIKTH